MRNELSEKAGCSKRESFANRRTAILAMAGSAIGLGNIWRFPYIVGEYGGGAFILVYVFCCFFLSMPIFISESVIGRATRKNTFGAMKELAPGSGWKWLGLLTVLTPMIILSYYSVVGGWSVSYLMKSMAFDFTPENAGVVTGYFGDLVAAAWEPIIFMVVFLLLCAAIVFKGVKSGIERFSKLTMPVLFLLMIIIAVYSVSLPGAGAGIRYMLVPDFSKLTLDACVSALGQSFFSLSLGVGTMLTYSSYMSKDENLMASCGGTALSDLLFAMIAGFAIMPAVFAANIEPSSGPGLIFETLPYIFSSIGSGGRVLSGIVAILFFVSVLVAALSSAVSLMEVGVACLVEEKKVSRGAAIISIFVFCLVLGTLCSLSCGNMPGLRIRSKSVFDFCDKLCSNYLMTLGALLFCVFVGWKMKKTVVRDELTNHGVLRSGGKLFPLMYFMIRYVAPIVIAVIMLTSIFA